MFTWFPNFVPRSATLFAAPLLALAACLWLAACDTTEPTREDPLEIRGARADSLLNGLFFPIPLHVYPETIYEILGPPSSYFISDGPFARAEYDEGPYAGLRVHFYDNFAVDSTGQEWSLHCAYSLDVAAPYALETTQGVRLGMPQSLVHDLIGPPNADSVYLDVVGRGLFFGYFDFLGAMYAVGDSLVYILDYDENNALERARKRTLQYRMEETNPRSPTCGRPG